MACYTAEVTIKTAYYEDNVSLATYNKRGNSAQKRY